MSNDMKLEILLKEPIKALQSIEAFYSPYEKLQRVLDVFRGVNVALTKTSKTVPSADDVLPTVILVIEYLRGEAGYAFTNLYSAAQFLQELDLNISEDDDNGKSNRSNNNSLSISSDELKRGLEKSRAVNKSKRNSITGGSGGTNGDFESHRHQKKGLISRGIDELLGGGDININNNNNNNDVTFAAIPVPPTLSVREVRAAQRKRIRDEKHRRGLGERALLL
ncbi:hypothetical protein FRACYDRAFT_246433 [Fragilariopsis cylindrus CCMP1102]|uniref:VPS9 domain-containing protein n=1 Tax=Fragilariopsis cylindrus CCMP1102 TaxID=635003 RepID=A0A1E7EXY3_9STRA|nr:hypothetical protein FRACYDRAFT_246433 [Fragilariopsis cylindrus CCMP1102]|eukprot:OEU10679.1 hypothetical protein FRACYDRAFT_246433 [Fragilariopsis cylindrus CCMP1102]